MKVTPLPGRLLSRGKSATQALTPPLTYRSRRRELGRRRRQVDAHPDSATWRDVVDLLRRMGVTMTEARRLTDLAARRSVPPPHVWRWVGTFDRELVVAVFRSSPADDVLTHVVRGTVPCVLPASGAFGRPEHGVGLTA